MLKTRIVSLSLLLLSAGVASVAQVRKAPVGGKADKEAVASEDGPGMLFEEMLPSTAQILVVDSFVANKTDFIENIPLDRESGQISTLDRLNGTTGQPFSYTYVNGFGNKMFFAQKGEDGHYKLFSADKLGDEWANVKPVDDFGEDLWMISARILRISIIRL